MPGFPGEDDGERICTYGTGYLLKQVAAVRKEIPGVLAANDIEHIHRMRVATRRLRSALPLFSLCFSGKKIWRWRRGLRETARALGEARDTDVQIAFLREYLDDLKSGRPAGNRAMLPAVIPPKSYPVLYRRDWNNLSVALRSLMRSFRSFISRTGGRLGRILRRERSAAGSGPVERPDHAPGTECVLLRKSQERAGLQKGIEKAIRRLERSGLIGELEKDLRRHERKEGRSMADSREIYATAFSSVTTRIDAILSLGEDLADPEKIREHHAMRIAVKRLRYTLEVWRDLFGGDLGNEIDTLKGLQDLLGDLHDCDVWIAYLPGFLRDEEERCNAFFGSDGHFRSLAPGIEGLARERRDRRRQLHEITLTIWRDLAFRDFWECLREKMILPLTGHPERPARIGLMSNISGDAGALNMVLADGRTRGAGLFLNAGDILGSPRASRETVEVLRKEGVVSVAGDRDMEILDGMPPAGGGGGTGKGDPGVKQSKLTRRFIRALPSSVRFFIAGNRILLTHGSPESPTESLDGGTDEERLCQVARKAGASVIVSGHAHLPFWKNACNVLFVNPGSVCRMEGGIPSYAILEIGAKGRMTVTSHELRSEPGGNQTAAILPGIPGDGSETRHMAGD